MSYQLADGTYEGEGLGFVGALLSAVLPLATEVISSRLTRKYRRKIEASNMSTPTSASGIPPTTAGKLVSGSMLYRAPGEKLSTAELLRRQIAQRESVAMKAPTTPGFTASTAERHPPSPGPGVWTRNISTRQWVFTPAPPPVVRLPPAPPAPTPPRFVHLPAAPRAATPRMAPARGRMDPMMMLAIAVPAVLLLTQGRRRR